MENLVKQYHKEQFRNDRPGFVPPKIPYFDHLIGVKTILSSALLESGECPDRQAFQDMCAAALGHDLIEDTEVSENEIIQATNVNVLSLIKELSNPVDDSHTEQYMKQLSNASEEARLIKYADLIENTASVCYSFHIVGKRWAYEFYLPILNNTRNMLGKTSFQTYPKTAGFMRKVLEIFAELLNQKASVYSEE